MTRRNEMMASIFATIAVVTIFMWVPVASILWIVSFWRADVRDISMWMLGIAGILATAGAMTYMAQSVMDDAPPEAEEPGYKGYEKGPDA